MVLAILTQTGDEQIDDVGKLLVFHEGAFDRETPFISGITGSELKFTERFRFKFERAETQVIGALTITPSGQIAPMCSLTECGPEKLRRSKPFSSFPFRARALDGGIVTNDFPKP